MEKTDEWDEQAAALDAFEAGQRQRALETLVAQRGLELPAPGRNVNMHFHSFFSYNAEDWSPSHIAWEARKHGLYAAGLCDFDVLDGLEEFLRAGRLLGLRATVNLETRVYLPEFADAEITSPGEPGVTYIMGAGFLRMPEPGSPAAEGQAAYRDRARARNTALMDRINAHLPDIALDYEQDVLPLTPAGSATERHLVRAYVRKSRDVFGNPAAVAAFWAPVLGRNEEETVVLLADEPALEESVRSKLAKRGGLGYVQPSEETFPPVDAFIEWVQSCEAVPMMTWLDGTSDGERDPDAMLDCLLGKGAAALNIIPDRNWNVAGEAERTRKQANLKAIVEAADRRHVPINIGTEMNKRGLPFVDALDEPALVPFRETFLRGARIMVGHTVLGRYAGYAYAGARAREDFGDDTQARNRFFEAVGALPPLTQSRAAELETLGEAGALDALRNAVK